jgi:hypothetical protein
METREINQHPPVRVTELGMLVLLPWAGGVEIHRFGAQFDEPASCRQAATGVLDWAASIDREKTCDGGSLDAAEYAEAGPHLMAFMDALESSYFLFHKMPPYVLVSGLGRWVFIADPSAAPMSDEAQAVMMMGTDFGHPSAALLKSRGNAPIF